MTKLTSHPGYNLRWVKRYVPLSEDAFSITGAHQLVLQELKVSLVEHEMSEFDKAAHSISGVYILPSRDYEWVDVPVEQE